MMPADLTRRRPVRATGLPLKSAAGWHRQHGTQPTDAASLATATVERVAHLPGEVVCAITAIAEVLADDTLGAATRVEWSLSDRPSPSSGVSDGGFFDAWADAIEGAWGQAVEDARQSISAGRLPCV